MAARGTVNPVDLLRISIEVGGFHDKISKILWIKFDIFNKLKLVSKVL